MGSAPVSDLALCPVCGTQVDKLRAGAMGIYGESVSYFCTPECKVEFGVSSFPPPPPPTSTTPQPGTGGQKGPSGPVPAEAAVPQTEPEPPRIGRIGARPIAAGAAPMKGARLVAVGLVGAVSALVPLVAPSPLVAVVVQIGCLVFAWAQIARWALVVRARSEQVDYALLIAASMLAAAGGVESLLRGQVAAAHVPFLFASTVAAIGALGGALEQHLVARAAGRLNSMVSSLPRSALIVRTDIETETELERVRAGEEVLVPAGEVVPVDGIVRSGEARIRPLPSSEHEERAASGSLVVAGGRVVEGELRIIATFVGGERALARIARLGRHGTARPSPLMRWSWLAGRLAMLVGVLGAVALVGTALAAGPGGRIVSFATAASFLVVMSGHALRRVPLTPLLTCVGRAAAKGAFFRDEAAIDAAARVGTVVLPARGTLTLGVPVVTDFERIGERDERELLGLAAAASFAASPDHPVTNGLLSAAKQRGIELPEVRRPAYRSGRGVLGAGPGGEALVVGSRQLLLSEGVSIAAADSAIGGLEQRGRTTVLVAVSGKIQAVIGLYDAPRPDARDAVQALAELRVEPVILTGDSRTTAEALGHALGVEHLRAEVEPEERAAEVRRLTESGTTVAVIGHPARDGAALDSADVAVALRWAGAPQGEPAIRLAGDRATDAVFALGQARQALRGMRRNLTIASGALVLGSILALGHLLPPPAAALLSTVAAVIVARPDER